MRRKASVPVTTYLTHEQTNRIAQMPKFWLDSEGHVTPATWIAGALTFLAFALSRSAFGQWFAPEGVLVLFWLLILFAAICAFMALRSYFVALGKRQAEEAHQPEVTRAPEFAIVRAAQGVALTNPQITGNQINYASMGTLVPRHLSEQQRAIIRNKVAPFVEVERLRGSSGPSLHILSGDGFDCGDYAKEFEDLFASAGFRVVRYSPGQNNPPDDLHYGMWVRWDRKWRDDARFAHDGPIIADALTAAGIDVRVIEREGLFTSLIVGSRRA